MIVDMVCTIVWHVHTENMNYARVRSLDIAIIESNFIRSKSSSSDNTVVESYHNIT